MSHFESFFSLLGGFWYIAEIRIVCNIHKILNVPPFWNITFEKKIEMSVSQYITVIKKLYMRKIEKKIK